MKIKLNIIFSIFSTFLTLGVVQESYGQRVRLYADWYGVIENEIFASYGGKISSPEQAIGANLTSDQYAILTSGNLSIAGNARLQLKFLKFKRNLPANTIVTAKVGNLAAADFGRTAQKDASEKTDADGTNVTLPSETMPNNTTVSFKPTAEFNAVSLNVTHNGNQRTGYVYHAYIEPYTLPLTFKNTSFTNCGPLTIKDILDFPVTELLIYDILDNSTGQKAFEGTSIQRTGTYKIKVTDPSSGESKTSVASFSVTINALPQINISQTYVRVPIQSTADFPTINCTGCAPPVWKDESGTTVPQIPAQSSPGYKTFTVYSTLGTCSSTKSIVVDYYNPLNECKQVQRVYGTQQGSLIDASVNNPDGGRDANPETFTTLVGTSLLGIPLGMYYIKWQNKIPKGTKVFIKLGVGDGLLGLASALSIQQKNGIDLIGTAIPVSGGILQLLVGENDLIFSLTTTSEIDQIAISFNGLLGLGLTAKIYDAWYEAEAPNGYCPPKDAIDALGGSEEILKGVLNAATVTVRTTNPKFAIDDNPNTYASMFSGVGVLAYAKLDIAFSSVSQPGDSVFIAVQNTVELLNLLNGFYIQRYLGDTPVGQPLGFGGNVLTLIKGLNNNNVIFTVTTEPYDRISIRYGGVVSVLSELRVFDVQRKPFIYSYENSESKVVLCEGEAIHVGLNHRCLTYQWYDSPTAGNLIHATISGPTTNTAFTPTNIGKQTFYIQNIRNGCSFGARSPFTIDVIPNPGKPHLTIMNVIN